MSSSELRATKIRSQYSCANTRSCKNFNIFDISEIEIDLNLLIPQTKLTMARCRRNVDNFLEACRKIGVDEVSVVFVVLLTLTAINHVVHKNHSTNH